MSDELVIQSHKGPYTVSFDSSFETCNDSILQGTPHFLIDSNIARLYESELEPVLESDSVIIVDANEENKAINNIIPVIEQLVANSIRRDHVLVAIGGGIVQDITCFIASTLLRGIKWRFIPTTLLAQADSCIGSKSSVNLRDTKNILGTFNPPADIFINTRYLDTLQEKDIRSGIGEIIKVHAIDGKSSYDRLVEDFPRLVSDRPVLLEYIRAALLIKKRYIEEDEFDKGIRNIFNYGHSFGHAIESSTHYAVPHGIAVTIGMDMANYIAVHRKLLPEVHYDRMHGILEDNYTEFMNTSIPMDSLIDALMKDKKNTQTMLGLIFPVGESASIEKVMVPPDNDFKNQCAAYIDGWCK